MRTSSQALKGILTIKYIYPAGIIAIISLLLLMPAIAIEVKHPQQSILETIHRIFFSLLFFLIPIAFFYRNIKAYLYLLLIWIVLTPFFLFSIVLFDVTPGIDLITLVKQTDKGEVAELASGLLMAVFLGVFILFIFLYWVAVKKFPYRQISFGTAIGISIFAVVILAGEFYKKIWVNKEEKKWFYFERYYPQSFLYGLYKTYTYSKENSIEQSKNFSFHAFKKDPISQRQIYILVIGESSRYDRWQINGYPRATSPRLSTRENLIVYPDVIAGGYNTATAVPQIITRAEPDNFSLQFKEKSILSAFKEAGFKTIWLSNQSAREIFTDGTITAHAKSADFRMFNPYETAYNEKFNYDEWLLPVLDSVIENDDKNYFIVVHTRGSHWDYSKRYPTNFDYFKPSGYTQSIYPPTIKKKEAFSNTYDNTIRYADFIIDSVINITKKYNVASTVFFISDHGENLMEHNSVKLIFHTSHTPYTLHIPCFIWLSNEYQKLFPGKKASLLNHIQNKIGTENTFYTLLDMANISFPGFDSTKSIANPSFKDSKQRVYLRNKNEGYSYEQFEEEYDRTYNSEAQKN